MRFRMIDAEEAPPRPKLPVNQRGALAGQLVAALQPGKVARVEVAEGESVRGTKTSITRAARRLEQEVVTWDHEGVVYVQLAEGSLAAQGTRRKQS